MRVSIFGIGYVGCVSAACLAQEGHSVIGVDVDPVKVNALNEGRAPFFEPGLDDLIKQMVVARRLFATVDSGEAIRNSEIALICVGTPTNGKGRIHLSHLKRVFATIGDELQSKDDYFVVALRSTVMAAAVSQELIPMLQAHAGRRTRDQLGFAYNPEFLREGVALEDFRNPPWTIIGSDDPRAAETVATLYGGLPSPIVITTMQTAVLVKYLSNAFHALKVAFANEAGEVCRELGADSKATMELFCHDTKLNISTRYLKPGFAFGGSCLPKDVKALVAEAARRGLQLPVLSSILPSNTAHLQRCISEVTGLGKRRIGLVGLAFKQGTDDLRESPAVELAERLLGKGCDIRIYEPAIAESRLHGSNRAFIEKSIPHIWNVLTDTLKELIDHAEVIVVMQEMSAEDRKHFSRVRPDQVCIDFVRTLSPSEVGGEYRTTDWFYDDEDTREPIAV